ncbi:MAG: ABC transporter permease [Alphaproteobacteria bacterium]
MLEIFARFRRSHEFWLTIVILAICVLLTVATDSFFTLRNLFDLLTSNAFVGILCAGLIVVLVAGGIDISFTATATITQYVALTVANEYGANWFTLFAMACALGVVCGAINAFFIVKFKIHSIIVSIATLNIFYGLLMYVTSGKYIYSLPEFFTTGINWFEFEYDDIRYAINLQMLLLVVCFALTWFLLNRTNIGRQIYAMGGNPDAAQRLGFSTFRLNMFVYCYMGFIAGIASLAQAQFAQSVAPTILVGKELDVLAAVVLGGASLNGGVGTVLGAFLGLTLLALLQNGLVLMGVSSYYTPFVTGAVILISVSATAMEAARQQRLKRART